MNIVANVMASNKMYYTELTIDQYIIYLDQSDKKKLLINFQNNLNYS